MRALKWLGTAGQIVGVFALASRVASPPLAYVVMQIGAAAWLIVALRLRDRPLAALNIAFSLANVIGIWQWWAG